MTLEKDFVEEELLEEDMTLDDEDFEAEGLNDDDLLEDDLEGELIDEDDEEEDPFEVTEIDELHLRVEHKPSGRYVIGRSRLSYGERNKFESFSGPKTMRFKGENNVLAYLSEYSPKNDPRLFLLKTLLVEWGKKEKLTPKNIQEDYFYVDVLDRFEQEIKDRNNLQPKTGKNSKKSNT